MNITPQQVRHVARLARIEVDETGIAHLAGQIASILDYVATLNEVDTSQVAPTTHAISLTNAFREDTPAEHMPTEMALANAPEQDEGSFIVPKVIG